MSSPADIRGAVPLLLTVNAGYVDTAGFLALQGLFTAHVTGNFVTLGASGGVAKLLALPVFCAVVIVTRLLSSALLRRHRPALRIVLGLKVILLVVGAVLATKFGPFANGDAWQAVLTGMSTNVLVFAVGCAAAALLYAHIGPWCFLLPPFLGAAALLLHTSQ